MSLPALLVNRQCLELDRVHVLAVPNSAIRHRRTLLQYLELPQNPNHPIRDSSNLCAIEGASQTSFHQRYAANDNHFRFTSNSRQRRGDAMHSDFACDQLSMVAMWTHGLVLVCRCDLSPEIGPRRKRFVTDTEQGRRTSDEAKRYSVEQIVAAVKQNSTSIAVSMGTAAVLVFSARTAGTGLVTPHCAVIVAGRDRHQPRAP